MSESKEEKEMSFLGHLEELRWRLVRSSSVIITAAVVIFYFTDPIVKNIYLAMSKTDFLTYKFFCWLSNSFGLSDVLCANDIPIQIQSIEMTKQFSTNMYFSFLHPLLSFILCYLALVEF